MSKKQKINRKTRERVFELTRALYRVTEKMSAEEPAREKLRKLSLDILEDFCGRPDKKTQKRLKAVQYFMEIAKDGGWVKEVNFDILLATYKKLLVPKKEPVYNFKIQTTKTENKVAFSESRNAALEKRLARKRERKDKTRQAIEEAGTISFKNLRALFPDASDRTLREDIKELAKEGLVKSKKNRREVIYRWHGGGEK